MKSTSAKTTRKTAQTADDFMSEIEHPFKDELQAVREIIRGVNKNITEEVNWDTPTFSSRSAGVSAAPALAARWVSFPS